MIGKALTGPLGSLWRYRVGDYRVICVIQHQAVTILVIRSGHRREVYR
jgi:mRNA interferase RelE/StbE